MQLPKVGLGLWFTQDQFMTSYSSFVDKNQIFVGYNDGKKLMTRIKSKTFHRTVPGSKFSYGIMNSVRIGDFFWLITKYSENEVFGAIDIPNRFLMWNIKKKTLMEVPSFLPANLSYKPVVKGCAINKTSAFLLPVGTISANNQFDTSALIINFDLKSHQLIDIFPTIYDMSNCVVTQDKFGHPNVHVIEDNIAYSFDDNYTPFHHIYNLELGLWTHSEQVPLLREEGAHSVPILSTILGEIYMFQAKATYRWSQKQQKWMEFEVDLPVEMEDFIDSVLVYYQDHCLKIGSCNRVG